MADLNEIKNAVDTCNDEELKDLIGDEFSKGYIIGMAAGAFLTAMIMTLVYL